MNNKRPVVLVILDGIGLSDSPEGDATKTARTPTMDWLWENCPHATLKASGEAVGLMEGQMGDSNVGHLNLGAGRIVYQYVALISKSIRDGEFFHNEQLLLAVNHAKAHGSKLHLMGLVSPGGVHSHSTHLYALLQLAKAHGLEQVYVHAFLDGRDVPPSSAKEYLEDLEAEMEKIGVGQVATISGRYYAMDRDKRWDRVEKAYLALTEGTGRLAPSSSAAIDYAYDHGETDEFVIPTVIVDGSHQPRAKIGCKDAVIFFNFRADRARELTWAFINDDFNGFERPSGKLDLCFVTMAQYDAKLKVPFAYPPQNLGNTLGEYLSKLCLQQLRIAETEKYAHVTYFFNGGIEKPYPGEDRKLIPSPKVATYDLKPEMSAPAVTDAVVELINTDKYDLIILNYANGDMVGHTGVMEAAVKAVEAVDTGLGRVLAAIKEKGSLAIVTADHGNAEQMIDPVTNEPHTAHTTNLVPIWLFNADPGLKLKEGILADIAPTLLELMGIPQPPEMTGASLIWK